ncbi:MAG: hypothetical protein JSV22_00870 [Bacteroidales bacterium]|nr:MAG: hypothetical protein JSV22_00870 [Bacteroidales bacterium]
MKVTGFTFIRNAIKYDYPIVESINSILPVCDDFIVAVGKSDDDTLDLIKNIDKKKIKIIETVWDDSLREGGRVLAVETDKAFNEVPVDSDWAFYIQGDEVVHEKYLETIEKEMLRWKDNEHIDGLLFKYLHFYGSYDYIGESYRWYRREIRIVRPVKTIYSYRDAQGFRKNNNEKLSVKLIDAFIYHYGWVKEPKAMQGKQQTFHKYWHNDEWIEQNVAKADEFDYSNIDALSLFTDSHPMVMEERIKNKNWQFDYDISFNNFKTKDKFKRFFEKITGYRIGEYRNYKII